MNYDKLNKKNKMDFIPKRQSTRSEVIKADEHELSDIAKKVVLHYFQSWDQGLEKKREVLNKAVKFVGLDAEFIQDGKRTGWVGENEEDLRSAKLFREELDKCFPIGSFEAEVCAVINVLEKYIYESKDKSLLQKIKNLFKI